MVHAEYAGLANLWFQPLTVRDIERGRIWGHIDPE
jgi:hypothetical protein